MPAPSPPARRRWLLAVVLTLFGTAALAVADRWLLGMRARWTSPTGAAAWIWEARNPHDLTPTAFYAVRDFDLAARPAHARLLLEADEEYVLTLNAKRLGAGRYRSATAGGTPLDVYDVAPWLIPGANRLLVELRSGRGAGGLLLALLDGDGRPLVVSGPEFRLFKRHQLGLPRGFLPVAGGETAFVWGMPPLGRWGRPVAGRLQPVLPARFTGEPIPAVAAQAVGPLAVRFDWGREVTGFLELELPPRTAGDDPAPRETGLLWTGAAPPGLTTDPPPEAVLPMADANAWLAPAPRRLRYALVAGLPPSLHGEPLRARLYPVAPAAPVEIGRPRGVLGIEAPPLRTPVEDEVRRKLKRVAGVALGKKG